MGELVSTANISNTMSNNNGYKYQIPDHDDSDLFSDNEPDSSDDEADLYRNNQLRAQNRLPPPAAAAAAAAVSKRAAEHESKPPDKEELKKFRREIKMRAALERVKNKESLPEMHMLVPPQARQPRRKRSKVVLTDKNKTRGKLQARKSIWEKQKKTCGPASTVVFDQHRVVKEDGELEFVRIANLKRTRFSSSGKRRIRKEPDPPIRQMVEAEADVSTLTSTNDRGNNAVLQSMEMYLERLGWTHTKRKKQYKLTGDGFTIEIPRARMLELVNKPSVGNSNSNSKLNSMNEFTAGRIEEELLISTVERRIKESAIIADSFVHLSEFLPFESTSPLQNDIAFDIGDSYRESNEQTSKKKATTGRRVDIAASPENTKFIRMMKILPNGGLTEAKVKKIRNIVLTKNKSSSDASDENSKLLQIALSISQVDEGALKLEVKGRHDLVKQAYDRILKFMKKKFMKRNCGLLLNDNKCIEVDVKLDIRRDFGFQYSKVYEECLWIHDVEDNSQFREIFGRKARKGAVITHLALLSDYDNMQEISDPEMMDRLKGKAEQTGEQWVAARICLSWGENLGGIDRDRFISRKNGGIMPRMRSKSNVLYRTKGDHRKCFFTHVPPPVAASMRNSNGNVPFYIPRKRKEDRPPDSSNENKKARRADNDRENNKKKKARRAENDTENNEKKKAQKVDNGRETFIEKMKNVEDIEFKNRGIHIQSSRGTMWAAHKKLFGEKCGETCTCPSQLSALTKDVVSNFVSKRRKNSKHERWVPDSKLSQSPGFADHFCSKFYERVQSSFPKDTPQETLAKLSKMWSEGHKKQMRFHASCSEECPCLDSWEDLFLPLCRGERRGKQSARRLSTNATKPLHHENIDVSRQVEIFRPSKTSLGCYCITKMDRGTKKCVITSIDPRRKASHVRSYSVGTIIEEYQVDSCPKQKLESHRELREVYENLKMSGSKKLRLTLMTPANAGNADCEKDWSKGNAWIGSERKGWAGGAMTIDTGGQSPMPQNHSHVPLGQSKKSLSNRAKEVIQAKHKAAVAEQGRNVKKKQKITKPPKKIGPVSILRKDTTSRRGANSVNFNLNMITHHTWEMLPSVELGEEATAMTLGSEKLEELLMSKSITTKRLIEKLKHCDYETNAFAPALKKFKEYLKYLQEEAVDPSNSSESKRDLRIQIESYRLRNKALKIFELANFIISGTHDQEGAAYFVKCAKPGSAVVPQQNLLIELEKEENVLLNNIQNICDWINRYQREKDSEGNKLEMGMDCDIDNHGVSLLHATVLVGNKDLIWAIMNAGAKFYKNADDILSPLQFATAMRQEALNQGAEIWVRKYENVIKALKDVMKIYYAKHKGGN